MCPVGITLELGFGQGPGGSSDAAHAALMGLRFHRKAEPVLFRRCLPGMKTLEKVQLLLVRNCWSWKGVAQKNAGGKRMIFWGENFCSGREGFGIRKRLHGKLL